MFFFKLDLLIQYVFKFLSYFIPKKFLLKILTNIPIGKTIRKKIIHINTEETILSKFKNIQFLLE